MNHFAKAFLLMAVLPSQLKAEPLVQSQLSFTPGSMGTWNADWEGVEDRTYFFQWSLDLVHWNYAPFMEFGTGLKSHGITCSSGKYFIRLFMSEGNGVTTLQQAKDADFDYDGLSNLSEIQIHSTDPMNWDTDGDGMNDGWEIQYGFNAKVDNATDANPSNDEASDPDGDHLTNGQESGYGTNPGDPDTDGDGVNDDVEINQGTNPNDPNDHDPPPAGTVEVNVKFGDHSYSHSEKYTVFLTPLEGDTTGPPERHRTNRAYGQTQTDTFRLPKGSKYKVVLKYAGTNPKYRDEPRPDYDYTLEFSSPTNTDQAVAVIPEDPDGILGVHDESETNFAEGKDATLNIAWLTSETVSLTPADRARLRLGVGEEVTLKVFPPLGYTTWTTTVGNLNSTTGDTVILTLDDTTGAAKKVTADYLGQALEKEFEIFAPTGVDNATVASTVNGTVGNAGAGMHLYPVVVAPTDVSFYNVQMLEVGQAATNITGYFTTHAPPSHVGHGADHWFQLDDKNQWPSIYDYAVLGSADCPAPWPIAGSFTWDIPAKWKVVTSIATSSEHTITGWNQIFSIQTGGTASVEKFGHAVTRTTSNISTYN